MTRPIQLPAPERRRRGPGAVATLFVLLAVALVVLLLVSAGTGQLAIPPNEVLAAVLRKVGIETGVPVTVPNGETALWNVRFPRVVLVMLVGAGLAVGGVLMQGVFGNPLADPSVVGVSSGAAAGAVVVIVLGWQALGEWGIAAGAFVGGLLATVLAYTTARSAGRTEVVTLVLTGIAVNAVAGAVVAFMTFLGDTQAREQIVFWQLGSFNGTRWVQVGVAAPLIAIGIAGAMVVARKLDLLALGERSARHVGLDVEHLRVGVIVLVAVTTSAAVAFCGIIGFVGLVVPHVVRMVVGPGHAVLVPASVLAGAVVLLAADLAARTLVPYAELPIGMLTALIGGPFFFWLLRSTRNRNGGWS